MTNPNGFDKSLSPNVVLQILQGLKLKLINSVKGSLNARGAKPRSESDDTLFAQFNTFLASVVGQGLERFAIDTYREIEKEVASFEQAHKTDIHKGSIFFNIGLFYLWSGDFDRALYYWQKAEDEDKKTPGRWLTISSRILCSR